jgi:hypothetical protein
LKIVYDILKASFCVKKYTALYLQTGCPHWRGILVKHIAINDKLIHKAVKLDSKRIKRRRDTRNKKQKMIMEIQGDISFRNDWDYKKERRSDEHGS